MNCKGLVPVGRIVGNLVGPGRPLRDYESLCYKSIWELTLHREEPIKMTVVFVHL